MFMITLLQILADAMGLGKTVMTISLMLSHSWKGASTGFLCPNYEGDKVINSSLDEFTSLPLKATKFLGFEKKLLEQKSVLENGGNLIVCPMTLLGQWKVLYTSDANNLFPCLMHVHTWFGYTSKLLFLLCLYLCQLIFFVHLLYDQSEIEMHAKPGSLSVYVHYGQSRPKDTKLLSQSDVVITTYGVLTSEFSAEVAFVVLFRIIIIPCI